MAKPDAEEIARLGSGYRFVYRVGPTKLLFAAAMGALTFFVLAALFGVGATAAACISVGGASAYLGARWIIADDDRALFQALDDLDVFT